jgi:tripartite ATP-independent transporter DctM subunit
LRAVHRVEDVVASLVLALMVALPLLEMATRLLFDRGIPGSQPFVQHLTLWIGFLGATLAAREGRLLKLASGTFLPAGPWREIAGIVSGLVGSAVCVVLAAASWELVRVEREGGAAIALGVEVWMAQLVLPFAFGLLALRLVWHASRRPWVRALVALGLALGFVLVRQPELLEGKPAWPWLLVIVVATLLGGPLFVALGGAAVFLFLADGVPAAAIPVETYRLAVNPTLAAIPLFTLTGFLLAEGRSSARLLEVFRAWFGWIPGGTAVVCALLCAFFTVFTGGSGVTILALGSLLLQALLADKYREQFSIGLLTASGSLGLLLPPALPLILYGIVAEISIEDLFIAGILPGLLLIGLVAGWGMREGIRSGAPRIPLESRRALRALWGAKWELALPVVVLVMIFGGFATLVEASAIASAYAIVMQCLIHRDVKALELLRVLQKCAVLVGGVLVILGVAMGLTSYLVDAQVAQSLLELVRENIESRLVFLLCLNLFLLLVGCLMDIFSATIVVVPLILPLGAAFDIHPLHLGIIFIANLELGYLTPPVGLNLFLASYRFEKPLLTVYRAAVPMLVILGIGVLLITYWPSLTLGILRALGRT